MFRIGIDLGGTKIEGIVLDPEGKHLLRKRIDTQQEHGYDHILDRIQALYSHLALEIGNQPHTLGLGAPGAVSPRTGLLKNANTVCLNGRALRTDLQERLKRNLQMQNDANCFAMAEALFGAGRGYPLVFGVIMGTGCGGGIVHHQQVVVGPQGIAGEWGHMSIDPNGPVCYCGHRGCVETHISGGGLQARYAEEFGERRTLKEIVKLAESGDPATIAFMTAFYRNFGRSLANLINVLDPDVVVLGGGVSNIDELYTRGIEQVARYTFTDKLETPIIKNQLGDSAGVIGAALIGI